MDRFEAMRVFTRVVEHGSFAGAAAQLGMSTSAVSRHVAQLESHLATRLLQRTTRKLSLTESGRLFHERCQQLLSDLAEAEEIASTRSTSPRGTLRVTAPISFGLSHLAPAIAAFMKRYPQVRFEVALSDNVTDLVDAGLDLAIRVGALGAQNVVARPLSRVRMRVCAAPSLIAAVGAPTRPEALADLPCLSYAYSSDNNIWRFERAGVVQEVRIQSAGHSNNGMLLAELAAQGVGFTYAPDFIVQPLLSQGRLQTVLDDWETPLLTLHAVYPTRRHLAAVVRSFADFLGETLQLSCPEELRLGTAPG
ncbi:LysR substrate-binding domain-containing protein [Niveibacterium sp. SC-1]|uniref:LysR family transcriptional regulator n=1 Tax=Niveibacterium sp. SC-1 TaxID=3135646 RepID=UPI00311D65D0